MKHILVHMKNNVLLLYKLNGSYISKYPVSSFKSCINMRLLVCYFNRKRTETVYYNEDIINLNDYMYEYLQYKLNK